MRLACSYWAPAALPSTSSEPPPCVVFLHGNASSRVGALEALETVLACGAALAAFDCAGSGLSEGDYVTLGWSERDDVAAIVAHLRGAGLAGAVALWGRSMGAAAALMHAPRDPSLAGLVLDSPFADLRQLANELIDAGRGRVPYHVPGIVVGTALRMVRASVRQRTGMDIFDLSPLREAPRSFVPALIIAGEGDTFVPPHHARQIYRAYAGEREILVVAGDHNAPRPRYARDAVGAFLRAALRIPLTAALTDDAASRLRGLHLRGLAPAPAPATPLAPASTTPAPTPAPASAVAPQEEHSSPVTPPRDSLSRVLASPASSLAIGPAAGAGGSGGGASGAAFSHAISPAYNRGAVTPALANALAPAFVSHAGSLPELACDSACSSPSLRILSAGSVIRRVASITSSVESPLATPVTPAETPLTPASTPVAPPAAAAMPAPAASADLADAFGSLDIGALLPSRMTPSRGRG